MKKAAGKNKNDKKRIRQHEDEKRCPTPREDIMQDTRTINAERLKMLTFLYRDCTYIRAASEKLQTVTLNGGISAKIGNIIDVPYFNERVANRLTESMRRAVEWIDVAGFVPFSVDPPLQCEDATGPSVGFGSDEAGEMMGHGKGNSSGEVFYEQQEGISEDTDPEQESRPRPSTVEPSDFDFMVPSLGVGSYKVYRDANDNKRRIVYVDNKNSNRSSGSYGEDEDGEKRRDPEWYVYTVEEPHDDGNPNSSTSRLLHYYERLRAVEQLEMSGAQLGYRPVVVTQPAPLGQGLNRLDKHRGFMTDNEAVSLSSKDSLGMPVGFKDAMREKDEHMRYVLQYNGIDPDKGVRDALSGGDSSLPKMTIETQRQYANVVKPTKIFDVDEKEKQYISRVAVEFGVPSSDLISSGNRFKPDRDEQSIMLIEKGRALRRVLTDLLYHVFDFRNKNRAQRHFRAALEANGSYMRDVEVVVQNTKKLIEKARKDAVKPMASPVAQAEKSAPKASVKKEKAEKGEDDVDQSAPENGTSDVDTQMDTNVEVTPEQSSAMPESVEDLINFVRQAEVSYAHITRVQNALESMMSLDRPLVISWKQPLISNASQIQSVSAALELDDAQKASLARFHYGMAT